MPDLANLVPPLILEHLAAKERDYLGDVFARFDGYPNLEQVWQLMDEQWLAFGCDPATYDARVTAFYQHPVWLLNGLFIEQHAQSLEFRRRFAEWVAAQAPKRVADYGGGFGGLARIIGDICPDASVEVIEPYPHPLAIAWAERTANVHFWPALEKGYDILIATDVFEHVPDPLALVAETAEALRPGGHYLIANCFRPVILCHLSQSFHFRHSWNCAMEAMGLQVTEQVAYGWVFVRRGGLNLHAARQIERRSQKLWKVTKYLPGRIARPLTRVLSQLRNE